MVVAPGAAVDAVAGALLAEGAAASVAASAASLAAAWMGLLEVDALASAIAGTAAALNCPALASSSAWAEPSRQGMEASTIKGTRYPFVVAATPTVVSNPTSTVTADAVHDPAEDRGLILSQAAQMTDRSGKLQIHSRFISWPR